MVASYTDRPRRAARVLLVCAFVVALVAPFAAVRTARAASGTFVQYSYTGLAGSRNYWVYTPLGYTTLAPAPLIVMLHGCTQNPIDFAAGTQMNDLADTKQFIVVYPEQSVANDPVKCWRWFLPANQVRDGGEPAVIAGITQTVMADTLHWNVDAHRVYVAGFSAGAAMTVVMGATYPDLYAAIGEESGMEYGAAHDSASNDQARVQGGPDPTVQGQAAYNAMGPRARVVPVIVFHGTADTVNQPVNGDQVVQQWMATDHLASSNTYNPSFLSPSTMNVKPAATLLGHPYSIRTWNDVTGHEVEEYWSIVGMSHAWSGGSPSGSYADPNGPSATQNIAAFLLAHVR
jgi:poly(hydroxyalkanoate) depolymerase family esterase